MSFLKSALLPQSHEDLVHLCAHIGLSFAAQDCLSRLAMKARPGAPHGCAMATAALATLGAGLAYKLLLERAGWGLETAVSMSRNSLGVALAALAMLTLG